MTENDATRDPMPGEAPSTVERKIVVSKTTAHWLLESLFIVVGVVVGFAVAEYGQRRQERELAARVLRGLQEEITLNIAQLEPAHALHNEWSMALARWLQAYSAERVGAGDRNARGVFLRTWPGFDMTAVTVDTVELPFPRLSRAAWDTAVSTGALRLIDYEITDALAEIYAWQESLPVIPTDDIAFFDSAQLLPATLRTSFAMRNLVIAEGTLLKQYKEHLPAIAAAAEAGD